MVSPAKKCFLPSEAGFSGFLAQRSRTNKCQHLCQMGAGWNFCAPQGRGFLTNCVMDPFVLISHSHLRICFESSA